LVSTDDGIDYDTSPENTHWKDHRYEFTVSYDNPHGDHFQADFLVDKNGAHPVRIKKIKNLKDAL